MNLKSNRMDGLIHNERGSVTIPVEYVFSVVAFTLFAGILTTGLVSDVSHTSEVVNEEQMSETTVKLASAIETVDRSTNYAEAVAGASPGSAGFEQTAQVNVELAQPPGGGSYRVIIANGEVQATTRNAEQVDKTLKTTTTYSVDQPVATTNILEARRVRVYYNTSTDQIEIENMMEYGY